MTNQDRKLLILFRWTMVFIGLLIIFFALRNQLELYLHFRSGFLTQGSVKYVSVCSPFVEFSDNNGNTHTVEASVACEGSGLIFIPDKGDKADVLYDPKNPKYAKIVNIYSDGAVHHLDNNWKIEQLAFALFGCAFIVMAFIPKKLR